jgi:tRNA A-37 threonylcarbamoyl transferase component Bud32
VSPDELERALRDLSTIGRLVKVRPYRQIWRFEVPGRAYYLKFYPREEGKLKRLIRGSSALREFLNLQALQRASVPSPRAVAHLSGLTIGQQKGDAVILEAIEPSVQLDHYLSDLLLRGERAPDHRELARQVIEIVQKLGQAKLGHGDLHLGNFLLHDGKLFLLDGYAVRAGGMQSRDLMLLAHSVSRFATKTDIVRAWEAFGGGPMPRKNPVRKRQWRKFLEACVGENRYFGRLEEDGWKGHFFRHGKFPRRWAPASQIDVSSDDWKREWPLLLKQINADELPVLKRSASGDVLAGAVTIDGRIVDVIIKRPKHKKWYRRLNEIPRGGRARRAWKKAWSLVVRDIPTAWPLLMMERTTLGMVDDSVIVFERVAGLPLIHTQFDEMDATSRKTLFHRVGRTLRLLESRGLSQYDSKMTNWMIVNDEKLGPVPVVIDVDGIRRWVPPMWPIDRVLRSLREHKQYTPEDSKWVCIGYAPNARLAREEEDRPPTPSEGEGGGEGEEATPKDGARSQVDFEARHGQDRSTAESSGGIAPSDPTSFSPHPNPLPAGERGPEGDAK